MAAETEPAFPQSCTADGHGSNAAEGMTLRDYFAAAALTGIVATFTGDSINPASAADGIAEDAYRLSDAMLLERDEP